MKKEKIENNQSNKKNIEYVSVLRWADAYNQSDNLKRHKKLSEAKARCEEHLLLNKSSDTVYFDALILKAEVIKEYMGKANND